MKQLRILLLGLLIAALLPLVASPAVVHADVDIYDTPGAHNVNGREWRTACERYSQTVRCRTEIKATQVSQVDGRFVSTYGWTFNNLTYKESPRSLWEGNPLAANGVVRGTVSWTTADGRKWRTECDTAATGRGGCRSYIEASVIEAHRSSNGGAEYRWTTKWVFNNLVRFSPTSAGTPPRPSPGDSSLATSVLAELPIKGRAPRTGYTRAQFGPSWADADRNGCDTRNDILRRDLTNLTTRPGTRECVILSGKLQDPYTATTINFVRGQGTSNEV